MTTAWSRSLFAALFSWFHAPYRLPCQHAGCVTRIPWPSRRVDEGRFYCRAHQPCYGAPMHIELDVGRDMGVNGDQARTREPGVNPGVYLTPGRVASAVVSYG